MREEKTKHVVLLLFEDGITGGGDVQQQRKEQTHLGSLINPLGFVK